MSTGFLVLLVAISYLNLWFKRIPGGQTQFNKFNKFIKNVLSRKFVHPTTVEPKDNFAHLTNFLTMTNIYALLVGIDAYAHPVPPLQGCVNDIKTIEEYLQGRVAKDSYQLHLRTLIDRDATR